MTVRHSTEFDSDLVSKYVGERKSMRQVASELGLNQGVVFYRLKQLGLSRRRGEAKIRVATGQRYGRWIILDRRPNQGRKSTWLCRCDCGSERIVMGTQLGQGRSRSCGCWTVERTVEHHWKGHGEIGGNYWSSVRSNARVRHLEFDYSIEQGWDLYLAQSRLCALSGLPIGFSPRDRLKGYSQTASLDRIDSSVGYLAGNVQWVHKDINRMKQGFSDAEYVRLCALVVRHRGLEFGVDGQEDRQG